MAIDQCFQLITEPFATYVSSRTRIEDLQGAISTHVELIGRGGFSHNQLVHTHTALDMLLNSLCEMHKANPYQEAYPTALLDLTNARTLKLKLENLWLSNSQELYARGKQIYVSKDRKSH